jgi:hypothetical protein
MSISSCESPEYIARAFIFFFIRASTWSFIKAIRGVITMQIPSSAKTGTWKVIDLLPPVGIRAKVSFFSETERIISSCKGLNEL